MIKGYTFYKLEELIRACEELPTKDKKQLLRDYGDYFEDGTFQVYSIFVADIEEYSNPSQSIFESWLVNQKDIVRYNEGKHSFEVFLWYPND